MGLDEALAGACKDWGRGSLRRYGRPGGGRTRGTRLWEDRRVGGREGGQERQGVRPIFWMRNLGWEECADGMECIIDSSVFMSDADFFWPHGFGSRRVWEGCNR